MMTLITIFFNVTWRFIEQLSMDGVQSQAPEATLSKVFIVNNDTKRRISEIKHNKAQK